MARLAFALCLLVAIVHCDVIKNPNVTIKEIMNEVGDEFLDIMVKGFDNSTDPLDSCEEPIDSEIEFLHHTREKTGNLTEEIDPSKKVIVLIHGWVSGPFGYGFPKLIDAYLKRYDANVIMVDWTKYAWRAYPVSVCEVPKVAKIVGNHICSLSKKLKVPLSEIHLVGHSLGGQMSGFIGQHLQETCEGSLGRITGLDPAGPLFQGRNESERLDASDALFVDVMHTNMLELGYYNDCGHADFYVNCGILQPGCAGDLPDIEEVPNLPLTYVSCEHIRALDYMAESVNSNKFKAESCDGCPVVCVPDALFAFNSDMGEDCDKESRGSFHLTTNSQAPFAKTEE